MARRARESLHCREHFLARARNQDIVRAARAQHPAHNFRHLFHRLAACKNYFRIALAQSTMMVNLCEPEVFVRKLAQLRERAVNSQLAALHCLQQISNVALVHAPLVADAF
jgi:hypothetical protein